MIKTKIINGRKEYRETVRHSCGHEIENVTYGYKMTRKQAESKRKSPCGKCQLKLILCCEESGYVGQ